MANDLGAHMKIAESSNGIRHKVFKEGSNYWYACIGAVGYVRSEIKEGEPTCGNCLRFHKN